MQGYENILGFGFLLIGIGLFIWCMLYATTALLNGFQEDDEVIEGLFAFICVPLLYDFFINSFHVISLERFLYITATIGFLSLIVVLSEYAFSKVNEGSTAETLVALLVFGGFAIFVLWRFYDIIMIRENFWVLMVPIVIIGVVIFAALVGSNAPNNTAQPAPQSNRPKKVARTHPAEFRIVSPKDVAANPKLFENVKPHERVAWLEFIVEQPKWNEPDRATARRILASLPKKPKTTLPKTIEAKPIERTDPRSAFDIPPQRLDE